MRDARGSRNCRGGFLNSALDCCRVCSGAKRPIKVLFSNLLGISSAKELDLDFLNRSEELLRRPYVKFRSFRGPLKPSTLSYAASAAAPLGKQALLLSSHQGTLRRSVPCRLMVLPRRRRSVVSPPLEAAALVSEACEATLTGAPPHQRFAGAFPPTALRDTLPQRSAETRPLTEVTATRPHTVGTRYWTRSQACADAQLTSFQTAFQRPTSTRAFPEAPAAQSTARRQRSYPRDEREPAKHQQSKSEDPSLIPLLGFVSRTLNDERCSSTPVLRETRSDVNSLRFSRRALPANELQNFAPYDDSCSNDERKPHACEQGDDVQTQPGALCSAQTGTGDSPRSTRRCNDSLSEDRWPAALWTLASTLSAVGAAELQRTPDRAKAAHQNAGFAGLKALCVPDSESSDPTKADMIAFCAAVGSLLLHIGCKNPFGIDGPESTALRRASATSVSWYAAGNRMIRICLNMIAMGLQLAEGVLVPLFGVFVGCMTPPASESFTATDASAPVMPWRRARTLVFIERVVLIGIGAAEATLLAFPQARVSRKPTGKNAIATDSLLYVTCIYHGVLLVFLFLLVSILGLGVLVVRRLFTTRVAKMLVGLAGLWGAVHLCSLDIALRHHAVHGLRRSRVLELQLERFIRRRDP
jgi:hypothetical protein